MIMITDFNSSELNKRRPSSIDSYQEITNKYVSSAMA